MPAERIAAVVAATAAVTLAVAVAVDVGHASGQSDEADDFVPVADVGAVDEVEDGGSVLLIDASPEPGSPAVASLVGSEVGSLLEGQSHEAVLVAGGEVWLPDGVLEVVVATEADVVVGGAVVVGGFVVVVLGGFVVVGATVVVVDD